MPVSSIIRPDGPGDATNLTLAGAPTNWQAVSEVTPDDATSHVSALTDSSYKTDLYHLSKYRSTGVIVSISVHYRCFTGGVTINQASAKASIKTGGTQYDGDAVTLPDGGWNTYVKTWSTNPKTGIAWTEDDIDTLQAGVSLRSPTIGGGNTSYCSQVYVSISHGSSTGTRFGSRVEGDYFTQKPSPSKQNILDKERLKRGGRHA